MFIKAFNFIIGITANWKNIIFLLITIYSVVITIMYTKVKIDLKNERELKTEQLKTLEEQYEQSSQETKILLYERYILEKEKLLDDYKEKSPNLK